MRETGFTLTELLVVTAIVAILLGIGVPSYRYITNSYRMSSEINGLLGDLQFARAEAIKEGQTVTVCASVQMKNCTGGANNWDRGWLVFSNPNNGPQPPAGSVLRVQDALTGSNPDTLTADNNVNSVSFNREGFATTAAGFPNTTITLREATGNAAWTRCLWITPVGLMTTETPLDNPSGTCQ